jgi:hypothetical protein
MLRYVKQLLLTQLKPKTEDFKLGSHFTLGSKNHDIIASSLRNFGLMIFNFNVKSDWNYTYITNG